MKLLSSGTTTSNINGNFEVEYTIDSFWRKLFGMKTKFKFYTLSREIKYNLYCNYAGEMYFWHDESGEVVTSNAIKVMITKVVKSHKPFHKSMC